MESCTLMSSNLPRTGLISGKRKEWKCIQTSRNNFSPLNFQLSKSLCIFKLHIKLTSCSFFKYYASIIFLWQGWKLNLKGWFEFIKSLNMASRVRFKFSECYNSSLAKERNHEKIVILYREVRILVEESKIFVEFYWLCQKVNNSSKFPTENIHMQLLK